MKQFTDNFVVDLDVKKLLLQNLFLHVRKFAACLPVGGAHMLNSSLADLLLGDQKLSTKLNPAFEAITVKNYARLKARITMDGTKLDGIDEVMSLLIRDFKGFDAKLAQAGLPASRISATNFNGLAVMQTSVDNAIAKMKLQATLNWQE